MTEKAGPVSRQYLLSNGNIRVEYYGEPINYADPVTGKMTPIDATLQDAVVSGRAVATNKANAFRLQLPRTLSGDWVSLDTTSVRIALRPASRVGVKGAAAVPLSGVASLSRSATDVAYPGAFGGAALSYESRADGVKETITLSAPTSTTVYSFDLSLSGLTPRIEDDGSISLLRSGESTAAYMIPKPSMWDSANATEAAFTDKVHYQISGTAPTYRLDVVPDQAWLADPARVYPVMIDPGVKESNGAPADTYISDYTTTERTTNYSSNIFVNVTYDTTGKHRWGIAQLGSALVSDMASQKASGYNVYAAKLSFYWSSCPEPTSITAYRTSGSSVNIGNVTWSTQPTIYSVGTAPVDMTIGRNYYDITPFASTWQSGGSVTSYCNVVLKATYAGSMIFRSNEFGAAPPNVVIDYAPTPAVTLSSPSGGSYWVTPNASWTYSEGMSNPQVEYQIAVATQTAGPSVASTDVVSAIKSAPLPVPAGGWVAGQTYYAHVRAASQPQSGGVLVWSPWSAWGSFGVTTSTPNVSSSTTSSAWFTESAPDDTNGAGRGSVQLSWPALAGADHYNVYLLDGATYRMLGTTTSASWSSAGKGIYPTDSQIASMAAGTTGNPYPGGSGLDLRDDPTPLYAKMAGATVAGIPAYFFKVTATNLSGSETTLSTQPTTTVQLANATKRSVEMPAYTDYDLGGVAGDNAAVHLNTGALTLTTTDLSVASFGPPCELTRAYISNAVSRTTFAPGWRFGFESYISPSGADRVYMDQATRVAYTFTAAAANTWSAPHGMVATLTQDPGSGAYALALKGGEVLAFDGTTGHLLSDTDRHADSVTYSWTAPGLHIRAANGHEIVVTIDADGRVTNATNTQDGMTREVDYASSDTSAAVTRHLGATETVEVDYAYPAANSALSTVSVAGFAPGGVSAQWGFAYNAGWLQSVNYPSSTTRTLAISADPVARTASVSRQARVGDLATSDSTVVENFVWDLTGRETAHSDTAVLGSSPEGTATTDYSPSGEARLTVSAAGVTNTSVTDSRGNEVLSWDAEGHTTSSVYNATDDLVSTTDPKGAQTVYTYNTSNGDMLTQRQQLNATDWAQTTWAFGSDTHGRPQSETKAITATASAVTQYSDYGDFTEPQTTTQIGVALSATTTVDLATQRTFDAFGQLLTETDPAGVTVKTNAYDLSGRVVSETDATGTVTHHRYDQLDNEVETSRTAGSAWSDWTSKTVDPTGLVLVETSFVTSAGAVVPLSTTTHVYDGSGNEIKAGASNVGTTTTAYSAQGAVSAQWDPAATSTSTTTTANTTQSDADGRALQSQVTTTVPATTQYAAGSDQVESQAEPGQAATQFSYDEAGNLIAQSVPLSDGSTATIGDAYDLGGRQVASTDASGNAVTTTYDLLGRVTSTALQGTGSGTSSIYNTQGWVLSSTDANGVVTTYVYDKDGKLTDQCAASGGSVQATHNDYDSSGQCLRTLNPDGSSVSTTYDAFGRQVAQLQLSSSETAVHDVRLTLDEAGRTISQVDLGPGGLTRQFTFAATASDHGKTVTSVGDTTRTVVTDATGLEATASLEVSGSVFSYSVARFASHQPAMWTYTAPTGTGGSWPLRDEAGRQSGALQSYVWGMDTYRYGQDGRMVTEAHTVPNNSMSYAYTDTGRLASVTATYYGVHTYVATTTSYAFDANGNITAAGATILTYNGAKLATSKTGTCTTTYTFDALGRRTSQSSPDASATYTWDPHADRLVGYTHRTRGSNDVTAAFNYDAAGQRTQSVVTSASVTTTTTYTYEGTQLFKLVAAAPSQTTTLTYIYNETGHPSALAAQVSGDPKVYFVEIATSARGDVLFLMDIPSTNNIDVLNVWDYDSYGNPRMTPYSPAGDSTVPTSVVTQIVGAQPLRYAGYAYDPFSGLYYCSQRYYDPATAQWISADPAKADGEASAYQYCGGQPINQADPSGLEPRGGNNDDGYSKSKTPQTDNWWIVRDDWKDDGFKVTRTTARHNRARENLKFAAANLYEVYFDYYVPLTTGSPITLKNVFSFDVTVYYVEYLKRATWLHRDHHETRFDGWEHDRTREKRTKPYEVDIWQELDLYARPGQFLGSVLSGFGDWRNYVDDAKKVAVASFYKHHRHH
jgi:RHS repeat-associated protein